MGQEWIQGGTGVDLGWDRGGVDLRVGAGARGRSRVGQGWIQGETGVDLGWDRGGVDLRVGAGARGGSRLGYKTRVDVWWGANQDKNPFGAERGGSLEEENTPQPQATCSRDVCGGSSRSRGGAWEPGSGNPSRT